VKYQAITESKTSEGLQQPEEHQHEYQYRYKSPEFYLINLKWTLAIFFIIAAGWLGRSFIAAVYNHSDR
jgi:hypothetical protein